MSSLFVSTKIEDWSNPDFVLKRVKTVGLDLQFASPELQCDEEIIKAAVKSDGTALKFASKEFEAGSDIVMDAVENDGRALEFAPHEFKESKSVVIAAVKSDWRAFEFASEELQADKAIVLAAVKSNGIALRWASRELQEDKEVVMVAVASNGKALEYASKKLRREPDIVLAAKAESKSYAGGINDDPKNTNDQLDYDVYADALVNVVQTIEESRGANFAVGLLASWGVGKTKLWHLIKEKILKKEEVPYNDKVGYGTLERVVPMPRFFTKVYLCTKCFSCSRDDVESQNLSENLDTIVASLLVTFWPIIVLYHLFYPTFSWYTKKLDEGNLSTEDTPEIKAAREVWNRLHGLNLDSTARASSFAVPVLVRVTILMIFKFVIKAWQLVVMVIFHLLFTFCCGFAASHPYKVQEPPNQFLLQKKHIFVDFNAWVYDGSDVLWASLMSQMMSRVEAAYGYRYRWFKFRSQLAAKYLDPDDDVITKKEMLDQAFKRYTVTTVVTIFLGMIIATVLLSVTTSIISYPSYGSYSVPAYAVTTSFPATNCTSATSIPDVNNTSVASIPDANSTSATSIPDTNCTSGTTIPDANYTDFELRCNCAYGQIICRERSDEEDCYCEIDDKVFCDSYSYDPKRVKLVEDMTVYEILSIVASLLIFFGVVSRAIYRLIIAFFQNIAVNPTDRLLNQALKVAGSEHHDYSKDAGFMGKVKSEMASLSEFLQIEALVHDGYFRRSHLSIFVDDLDRCKSKTVVQVLRAVILLLEGRGEITFWLAIDPQIVVSAIDDDCGDFLRNAGADGVDFLDKIIQLPFCIPHMNKMKKQKLMARLFIPNSPLISEVVTRFQEFKLQIDNVKVTKSSPFLAIDELEDLEIFKEVHSYWRISTMNDLKLSLKKTGWTEGISLDEKDDEDVLAIAMEYIQYLESLESKLSIARGTTANKNASDVRSTAINPSNSGGDARMSVTELEANADELVNLILSDEESAVRNETWNVGGRENINNESSHEPKSDQVKRDEWTGDSDAQGATSTNNTAMSMMSPDERHWLRDLSKDLPVKVRKLKKIFNVYSVVKQIIKNKTSLEGDPHRIFRRKMIKATVLAEMWPPKLAWILQVAENTLAGEKTKAKLVTVDLGGMSMNELVRKVHSLCFPTSPEKPTIQAIFRELPLSVVYHTIVDPLMHSVSATSVMSNHEVGLEGFVHLLEEFDENLNDELTLADVYPLDYAEFFHSDELSLRSYMFNLQDYYLDKALFNLSQIIIHCDEEEFSNGLNIKWEKKSECFAMRPVHDRR